MKEILDKILIEFEDYRNQINDRYDDPQADHHIKVCEAIVAREAGYDDRWSWRHLQREEKDERDI